MQIILQIMEMSQIIDKPKYDTLLKEIPKAKHITPSVVRR